MSTLRRSVSSSNIPRLSRLPIRNSGASKPPRSSSARSSNVNTNLLRVSGSGTMGRASSYSNLFTPLGRRQCSTPASGTSSVTKDSKIHDKDWQKREVSRVKMCFPEIILKPLTIRVYVHTMDILLKRIDNRISITMDNYKSAVPDYMKSFKYPYNLKASIVNSPTVPTSWVYILQMWSWLLDLTEILQYPESVESTQSTNHAVLYMANRFICFNSEELKEEDADKDYLEQMAKRKDVTVDKIKQIEEEEIYLDKELERIHAAHTSGELSVKEMNSKVSNLRDENGIRIQKKYDFRNKLQDQIRELLVESKNLQACISENKDEVKKLEICISQQTHTNEDLIEIDNKIHEAGNLEKYKNKCRQELASKTEEYDAKLKYQKEKVNSTVYDINIKIVPLICKAPELRDFKLPENILSEPDPVSHIIKFNEQIKKLNIDSNLKSQHLQEECKKLEEEIKQNTTKLEALQVKINEFSELERENECAFDKKCQVHKKRIDKKHLQIAELQQKRKNLADSASNIELLKEKLETYIKKEAELQSLAEEMVSAGEDLIVTAHNNIETLMDTQKAMFHNIQDSLENDLDAALEILEKQDEANQ